MSNNLTGYLDYTEDTFKLGEAPTYENFIEKIIELHQHMKENNVRSLKYKFSKMIRGVNAEFVISWERILDGHNGKNNIITLKKVGDKDFPFFAIEQGLGEVGKWDKKDFDGEYSVANHKKIKEVLDFSSKSSVKSLDLMA